VRVHAEIQLAAYYALYPDAKVFGNFIGASKMACFCCYRFLNTYGARFKVKGSHQKIYSRWVLPAFPKAQGTNAGDIRDTWCKRLVSLTRDIENEISGVLITRSRTPRLPDYSESTATPIGRTITTLHNTQQSPPSVTDSRCTLTAQNMSVTLDELRNSSHETALKSQAVLLLHRHGDVWKRCCVSLQDFWSDGLPLWDGLVQLLRDPTESNGLCYAPEEDVMVLDGKILVTTQRQFRDSLQYFANAGVQNIEGYVCKRKELH